MLHGLPDKLRGLLHRAEHYVADPRHAGRQAGGGTLCATAAGLPLRVVWQTRAPGGLRQFKA